MALFILSVIATLTIPKVLIAQQNAQWKAQTKEVASAIAQAYDAYKLDKGQPTASLTSYDLAPYLNYVKIDTTTSIDGWPNTPYAIPCGWNRCIRLHNGRLLYLASDENFGGTNNTNVIQFLYDPDGKLSDPAAATYARGSLMLLLYYNGRLQTVVKEK